MRARTFWIALPIAVVFALWAGPGLATEDEMPPAEPVREQIDGPIVAPVADQHEELAPADPIPPAQEPECETPVDPGPDGDQ